MRDQLLRLFEISDRLLPFQNHVIDSLPLKSCIRRWNLQTSYTQPKSEQETLSIRSYRTQC